MINPLRYLTLALLVLALVACGSQPGDGPPDGLGDEQLSKFSAEFAGFYSRFHTDSTFQTERITWPLDGNLQQDDAGNLVDVRWQPEDWNIHKPLDLGNDYLQEVDNSQPDLVIERIKTSQGAYLIERRFAKLGSEWWLIYYRVANVG